MLHPLLRHLPLALALCAAGAAEAKNLVVCTEASPEGFDIVQYTGAVTADASAETVFNRLLAFRPGTTEVIPGLAERWDVSADGLSYTFHLRPGVKFHTTDYFKPTRSLNADDVLWTVQRALDPKHPWHASALRGYAYFDAMGMGELIKSVEKVDELTVRFVLNRPEAPFLRDMAMPFASIYSAEYGDQLLAAGKLGQLNNQPIGTGPFVFKRYAKDAQVRYTANPDYYAGKPPIDNLVFAITLDPNVRMQKVRAGECQVSLYPKPEDVPRLKQDPNLAVDEIDALLTTYIAINTQHKPLDDPRVRQAINLALDKKAMLDAVFGPGAASPAVGPYPPDPARLQPFDPGLAARSRTRQGAAQGSRCGKSQDHPVHSQRHLAYHPQPRPGGTDAASRPGQGRHPTDHPFPGMGRAAQAFEGRRARPVAAWLGRRQRRPGQLPQPEPELRRRRVG